MHPTPPSLLFWRWFHVVWPCSSELRSWRRGRNSKRGVLICFARRVRWSPYQWSRRRWNNHYTDSFDDPSVLPVIGIVHKWIKEKNNKFIFFSFLLIPEKYPSFYEIKKSVVRWIHIVQSTPPTQNEWRASMDLSNPLGARPAWRMHTIELYSIQTSFMNADTGKGRLIVDFLVRTHILLGFPLIPFLRLSFGHVLMTGLYCKTMVESFFNAIRNAFIYEVKWSVFVPTLSFIFLWFNRKSWDGGLGTAFFLNSPTICPEEELQWTGTHTDLVSLSIHLKWEFEVHLKVYELEKWVKDFFFLHHKSLLILAPFLNKHTLKWRNASTHLLPSEKSERRWEMNNEWHSQ